MSKKILTDDEISKAFDASWATHGDRPTRFARIIEYLILEKMEAFESLREIAGMNCERLPMEVREALHKLPDINKTHQCELSCAAIQKATSSTTGE